MFRDGSRAINAIAVRSGTKPKILTCLTWPAITAVRDAGVLQDLEERAEMADRHPMQVGLRRAGGRGLEVFRRFFLDADDGDVVAERSRGIEHEEREPPIARNDGQFHRERS